jgi:branched-chain amino acid aminotransferase
MNFPIFSKNGNILPIEEARVSLMSVEYAYGFGVYETIRVKNDKAVFLADHIERLESSANIINLEHKFSKEDIEKYVVDFIAQAKRGTFNLKILLVGGQTKEDAVLYIMGSNPLFVDKKLYQEGAKVITTKYERIYPQAKTLNMLSSYIAYKEAKEKDCYDALLVNREGNITEGTRTNFFAVKGNIIYSPFEKGILLGVMRKHVIDVAKQNGFMVEENNIPFASISEYDGAFLTSTSTKILPIKKIDDFEYPEIPSALKKLMAAFDAIINQ